MRLPFRHISNIIQLNVVLRSAKLSLDIMRANCYHTATAPLTIATVGKPLLGRLIISSLWETNTSQFLITILVELAHVVAGG